MWLDKQVSIYNCLADNAGRPATYREILLSAFAIEHEWYFKDNSQDKWISGLSNDMETITALRTQEIIKEERSMLKQTLQCYTPAGLLKSKKQGQIEVIERTGTMQLDWDYPDIKDYDIEDLKQAVFALPFIAFCGLSCSGNGFFALALIAEPERLTEYAEHLFKIFQHYHIPVDTSKGRNINDLRFVSYDKNMLIRENPEPLRIKHFKAKQAPKRIFQPTYSGNINRANDGLIKASLDKIQTATTGQRWQTIQQAAFTLGGLCDPSIIDLVKNAISNNPEFSGQESKYFKCAEDCFNAGNLKPIQ